MATTLHLFNPHSILYGFITLALVVQFHGILAAEANADADEEYAMDHDEEYKMDHQFLGLNLRAGSRFLANAVKKGANCNNVTNNICQGVSIEGGSGLLQCCKAHCRDVKGDRNNCGGCGRKCSFGELCCHGTCTSIAYDVDNCGKCDKKCKAGVKCEYGNCGYA